MLLKWFYCMKLVSVWVLTHSSLTWLHKKFHYSYHAISTETATVYKNREIAHGIETLERLRATEVLLKALWNCKSYQLFTTLYKKRVLKLQSVWQSE